MGCGQSHIAVIYPRKSKGKSSNSGAGSEDEDEDGQTGGEAQTNPAAEESPPPSEQEDENQQRMRIQISSPLLAQTELSTSQSDFFKMLDEKINNGPDYDPPCEFEFTMDQAQLCRFLQEWQAAKLRSKCGLTGAPKLQRYHSLQSNGDLSQRKLHHQMSTYTPSPHHYQYPHHHPYPPSHYQMASNSVVMYDKRGGYYTELA